MIVKFGIIAMEYNELPKELLSDLLKDSQLFTEGMEDFISNL